jgi:hypothetical protein
MPLEAIPRGCKAPAVIWVKLAVTAGTPVDLKTDALPTDKPLLTLGLGAILTRLASNPIAERRRQQTYHMSLNPSSTWRPDVYSDPA